MVLSRSCLGFGCVLYRNPSQLGVYGKKVSRWILADVLEVRISSVFCIAHIDLTHLLGLPLALDLAQLTKGR